MGAVNDEGVGGEKSKETKLRNDLGTGVVDLERFKCVVEVQENLSRKSMEKTELV
jgi:hypothetical protein